MTFVYIIYDYEEQGAENVHATLDRAKLPELLEAAMRAEYEYANPAFRNDAWRTQILSESRNELNKLLGRTDEELLADDDGRHNLNLDWGGWVLQIVRLDA